MVATSDRTTYAVPGRQQHCDALKACEPAVIQISALRPLGAIACTFQHPRFKWERRCREELVQIGRGSVLKSPMNTMRRPVGEDDLQQLQPVVVEHRVGVRRRPHADKGNILRRDPNAQEIRVASVTFGDRASKGTDRIFLGPGVGNGMASPKKVTQSFGGKDGVDVWRRPDGVE